MLDILPEHCTLCKAPKKALKVANLRMLPLSLVSSKITEVFLPGSGWIKTHTACKSMARFIAQGGYQSLPVPPTSIQVEVKTGNQTVLKDIRIADII